MNVARFRENLLIYGANLMTWPDDERIAAEALLRDSAEAASVYSEEVGFESMLCQRRYEPPKDDLVERIITAATATCRDGHGDSGGFVAEILAYLGGQRLSFGVVVAAVAVILIVGFVIGYVNQLQGQTVNVTDLMFDYTGEIL